MDGRMLRTSRKSSEYLTTEIRFLHFTIFSHFICKNAKLHGKKPAVILEVNFEYLEVR